MAPCLPVGEIWMWTRKASFVTQSSAKVAGRCSSMETFEVSGVT